MKSIHFDASSIVFVAKCSPVSHKEDSTNLVVIRCVSEFITDRRENEWF